jgi:hypothetical protein
MEPLAALVDVLPLRLWRLGNLHQLPGGDVHFCIGPGPDKTSVRTIEWRGRVIARGRHPVDPTHFPEATEPMPSRLATYADRVAEILRDGQPVGFMLVEPEPYNEVVGGVICGDAGRNRVGRGTSGLTCQV